MTATAMILGLALLAAGKPDADPDLFPLALHRSMEIDDLDREIQRLHDSVLVKRAQLASTQRLAQRGLVSRSDLEKEMADYRYNEAREAEAKAFRTLKAYERDVQGHLVEHDEKKVYGFLLDLLEKRKAMARVDADYREFVLKQTRALFQRRAVSRQELEDAELDYNTAVAGVALNDSREAQVKMELTARNGEKLYDADDYQRLKADYVKARIRYYEVAAEGARHRLEIAQERSKRGLIPTTELPIFVKAVTDADATLAAERDKLESASAEETKTR